MKSKLSPRGILIGVVALVAVVFAVGMWTSSPSGDIIVKERIFFKWKNSLDVEVNDKAAGKVAENIIQVSRTFTWTDASGSTAATARVAIISWGTEINVYDGAGKKVGSIEERVFSRWGRTWTGYDIKDGDGNKIASSDKTEWMGTTIKLTAPDGTLLAKLDRPWINPMGDTWGIKIEKPGSVDKSVLVMIAAFKTAADRDKDSGSSKDSTPKKK